MTKSSDVAFGRQGGRSWRYTKDDCAGPVLPDGVARVYCSEDRQVFLVALRDVGRPCLCGEGMFVRFNRAAAAA